MRAIASDVHDSTSATVLALYATEILNSFRNSSSTPCRRK